MGLWLVFTGHFLAPLQNTLMKSIYDNNNDWSYWFVLSVMLIVSMAIINTVDTASTWALVVMALALVNLLICLYIGTKK